MFLFCLVFAMSLCASVYMFFVVTCWERADLLALVCGVYCEFVTFPLVSWVRCGTWLYRFLIFAPLLNFTIDFVHNWIHLFEFGMRLCNKYTRSNLNKFNQTTCDLLFARWILFETFVIICWLLIKSDFFKNSYRNTIRVSNGLYSDQYRRSVITELGTMLSADKESVRNLGNNEYKSG